MTLREKKSLVLVTGATGAVGPRVVQSLHRAGFRIRTFSFDAPEKDLFPPNVEVLLGDITDPGTVQAALHDVDAVIHLAALVHRLNPPPEMRKQYERVNIGGTAIVIEAALKESVKRIVLFSTIAVYGPTAGRVLDEKSPTHPDTFYAQTKLESEKLLLACTGGNGNPLGTVLRLGAVYGSRIRGNYERLTRSLARHRFIPVGSGRNRRTLIYDKDVGRAAVLAISHPSAAGRVFNVTDGQFHSLKEIINSICAALGRRPPRFSIPVFPMRSLVGVTATVLKWFGQESSITQATIDKYVEDVAVDGSFIQKELGFLPQYDLKTAWEETIKEMRVSGPGE